MSKAFREPPYVKYSNQAAERRGRILNRTIDLERTIDLRIASYYAKDEPAWIELSEMVLTSIGLRDKISTLMWVLKKYDKDLLLAFPAMASDLEKIRKNRNALAHSWLDATVTYVGNRNKFKPHLSKFKTKGNPNVYDETRIKELEQLIISYTHRLSYW